MRPRSVAKVHTEAPVGDGAVESIRPHEDPQACGLGILHSKSSNIMTRVRLLERNYSTQIHPAARSKMTSRQTRIRQTRMQQHDTDYIYRHRSAVRTHGVLVLLVAIP